MSWLLNLKTHPKWYRNNEIRAEINENRKQKPNNSYTKSYSFERLYKHKKQNLKRIGW